MDLLLTILKVAGIIVSGSLGILGTITRTHEEVEIPAKRHKGSARTVRRLTPWGKWALGLTITGFITALGAQVAESWRSVSESKANQQRAQQQIEQANLLLSNLQVQGKQSAAILTNVSAQGSVSRKSLQKIERIVTRLERLEVTATYKGTLKDTAFTNFVQSVDEIRRSFQPKNFKRESKVGGPTYSVNVVSSIMNRPSYPGLILTGDPTNLLTSLSVDLLESPLWTNSIPAISELGYLFEFLRSPAFRVTLYSKKGGKEPSKNPPDFEVTVKSPGGLIRFPSLESETSAMSFEITWVFQCPKSSWRNTPLISSMLDLDEAQVVISFTDAPRKSNLLLTLQSLALDFDGNPLSIAEFSETRRVNSNDLIPPGRGWDGDYHGFQGKLRTQKSSEEDF